MLNQIKGLHHVTAMARDAAREQCLLDRIRSACAG